MRVEGIQHAKKGRIIGLFKSNITKATIVIANEQPDLILFDSREFRKFEK